MLRPIAAIRISVQVGRMVLNDAQAEIPFEASFDACSPYDDDAAASALINQGWALSLNAAFCVLHELCLPPHPGRVAKERMHELISRWAAGPEHPLKEPLLRCANALVEDASLAWVEAVEMIKLVEKYDGQRAALAIVYFAGAAESEEADRALTEIDADIRRKWDERGV